VFVNTEETSVLSFSDHLMTALGPSWPDFGLGHVRFLPLVHEEDP
jgi:hypothetical protein